LELERIVAELEQERDRLSQVIAVLKERNSLATARKTAPGNGKGSAARLGGGLTSAGRKRLSEPMKKRWAERRRRAKSYEPLTGGGAPFIRRAVIACQTPVFSEIGSS